MKVNELIAALRLYAAGDDLEIAIFDGDSCKEWRGAFAVQRWKDEHGEVVEIGIGGCDWETE